MSSTSTGEKFGTFVSFSDVFGTRPTHDDLIRLVCTYKQAQWLVLANRVTLHLKSWLNRFDAALQDRIIAECFPESATVVQTVRRKFEAGMVFTRLGLLFLQRQVLEYGTEEGREFEVPKDLEAFGRALLMCNDLFLGYTPSPDDDLLQRAAGFLPAYESVPRERYADEVARSILMARTVLARAEVRAHSNYFDVESDLARAYQLSIESFCYLIFGLAAHAAVLAEHEEGALHGNVVIPPGYFAYIIPTCRHRASTRYSEI